MAIRRRAVGSQRVDGHEKQVRSHRILPVLLASPASEHERDKQACETRQDTTTTVIV
jgi:hypothetical protein